jgi:hypothetical protein
MSKERIVPELPESIEIDWSVLELEGMRRIEGVGWVDVETGEALESPSEEESNLAIRLAYWIHSAAASAASLKELKKSISDRLSTVTKRVEQMRTAFRGPILAVARESILAQKSGQSTLVGPLPVKFRKSSTRVEFVDDREDTRLQFMARFPKAVTVTFNLGNAPLKVQSYFDELYATQPELLKVEFDLSVVPEGDALVKKTGGEYEWTL